MNSNFNDLLTPCFIFDEREFECGILKFKNALAEKFSNYVICFSVKTNSMPYAMMKALEFGCLAEVVSHDEYRLARLCGFAPERIIYNGPMKSKETFLMSLMSGGIVNIETKMELKWLEALPEGKTYDVGLRLNINISHVSMEDADGDDDNSRFGFSDESDEFAEAVDYISSIPKLRLAGLHIHRTTHSRSPRFYERSVAYAVSVIQKYDLKLDYLDVGGGFFGIFPNKPTFMDYTEAIYRPLTAAGLQNLRIIVEPGNALTASPFKFLTDVIDVKRVDDKIRFVTTDGSRNDVDPFFRKTDYLKEIIYASDDRPIEKKQVIAGCSCLEYDRLFTLEDAPALEVGDRILYNNVGAYTFTLSPQFIRFWPRVYALSKNGEYHEVRRPTTADDIFKSSIY